MKTILGSSNPARRCLAICSRYYRRSIVIALSIAAVSCSGALDQANRLYDSAARSSAPPQNNKQLRSLQALTLQKTYFLQPDDVLDVKFFYSPELNENLVIRPDGKITLQLVGESVAAGRTTEDLADEIKKSFNGILINPEIAVIVRQHAPQRVYVAGEVGRPGELILQGDLTALQAIIKAGDFTQDAERGNVVILRHNGTATPEYIVLDFVTVQDERKSEETDQTCKDNVNSIGCARYIAKVRPEDFVLQPFDVVFAPQTKIASAANFFQRYVNVIFPVYRNLGLSAFYQINPITQFLGH